MTDFVEQCRQEWRRLRVPDPLAEEMAADLASDLAEAAAEGVSAEEYLGESVFDPQSFAASWAAERGVVPAPRGGGNGRRRPFVLAGFTALAAITVVVAALLLLTGNPRVTLSRTRAPHVLAPPAGSVFPHTAQGQVLHADASAPVEWILLFVAVAALGFAGWLWANRRRLEPPAATA